MVRGSAVFSSIATFYAAVLALTSDECEVLVLRVKDRVSRPLASGYRDVLLNVGVKGCDLVAELQLHFEDVIAVKVRARCPLPVPHSPCSIYRCSELAKPWSA